MLGILLADIPSRDEMVCVVEALCDGGHPGVSSAPRSSLFLDQRSALRPLFFHQRSTLRQKSSQRSKLQLDLRIGTPRSTYTFI